MMTATPGGSVSSNEGLHADPRWQLIQRIVESPSFARASRLSDFLVFISEKTLLGRGEDLNEQEIGVGVFGRSADYSRSDDNIVRANASRVRQKLDEYFATAGRSERMRVYLPKGGYIPEFQIIDPLPQDETTLPSPDSLPDLRPALPDELREPSSLRLRIGTIGIAILVLVTIANLWVLRKNLQIQRQIAARQPLYLDANLNRLWNTLFVPGKDTFLVPGDAGLNMYTNLDKRVVDIQEYTSGSYLNTPAAAPAPGFHGGGFAARRYVSITDLELVSRLTRLPAAELSHTTIRFARDIRFDELKNGNAVLLGSPNYNPWVTLFDRNLDFRMKYNGQANTISIENKSPRPGELPEYTWSQSDPSREGYALIALTDNLEQSGKVLLVEGTTSAGVSTASDALFNPGLMDEVIRKASDGNGRLSNFEVLLKTTFYDGGTLQAHVITEHVH